MDSTENLKRKAMAWIDAARDDLLALSRRLQANPETAYQEHLAAVWLSEELRRAGFEVEQGVAGLPTAFVAAWKGQEAGPCIGLIAEYDALPGVGHGCGHNLIATGAIGAALGAAAVMPDLRGSLKLFGAPAEEYTGGRAGKLLMLEAGVFDGVEACLMFHPWTDTCAPRSDLGYVVLDAIFHGKSAHAAADPWNGLNALDGVFVTYAGLSALRQQMRPDARLHVIVTDGGEAVNSIPRRAALRTMFRSPDRHYLDELRRRIEKVIAGAAQATDTRAEIQHLTTVYNSRFDTVLYHVVRENLARLGVELNAVDFLPISSDFGNVSQTLPAFYFMMKTHPTGINWHSTEVAEGAIGDQAHAALLIAAKALGASVVDLLGRPELLGKAAQQFADAAA